MFLVFFSYVGGGTLFLPGGVGGAGDGVVEACGGEEEVAEAVEVGYYGGVDVAFGGEGDDASFGASADCAGDVGAGAVGCASGEYEASHGLQSAVDGVDGTFEACDVVGRDGGGGCRVVVAGLCGEIGSDDEKLILDRGEDVAQVVGCRGECAEESEV